MLKKIKNKLRDPYVSWDADERDATKYGLKMGVTYCARTDNEGRVIGDTIRVLHDPALGVPLQPTLQYMMPFHYPKDVDDDTYKALVKIDYAILVGAIVSAFGLIVAIVSF